MLVAQPFGQRSAHLARLQLQFGRFAGLQYPIVQSLHLCQVAAAPGGQCLGQQGQIAARLCEVQLVEQPLRKRGFGRNASRLNGSLKPFGVGKAADGQSGGGQPHELQQAGRRQVGVHGRLEPP